MNITLLETIKEKSILKLEDGTKTEFVVCTDFDDSKPDGEKWIWGHYYTTLMDAVKSLIEPKIHYLITILPDSLTYANEWSVVDNLEDAYDYIDNWLDNNCDITKEEKERIMNTIKETNGIDADESKVAYISISEYMLGDTID